MVKDIPHLPAIRSKAEYLRMCHATAYLMSSNPARNSAQGQALLILMQCALQYEALKLGPETTKPAATRKGSGGKGKAKKR